MSNFRVLVLISGRGSNFRSLYENRSGYEIAAVISDHSEAAGLDYARQARIPAHILERKEFPSRSEYRGALLSLAKSLKPDLVALAGFMQIINPAFVQSFYGRLINIHPALLPKFPGLNTHERVIAAREQEHGCTVHFVDEGMDTGPIIAQAALTRLDEEDANGLAARVLKLEHRIYPWVVKQLACGAIRLKGQSVLHNESVHSEARLQGFRLP